MGRTNEAHRNTLADAVAVVGGALLGVAAGVLIGSAVGRVNAARLKRAVTRWRGRPSQPRIWTDVDTERLEARVLDALNRDVVLARRAIRVAVLGAGLVELSGRVQHAAEVGLAGDIVQRVPGVLTVLNHILVDGVERSTVDVPGPRAPRAARG